MLNQKKEFRYYRMLSGICKVYEEEKKAAFKIIRQPDGEIILIICKNCLGWFLKGLMDSFLEG